MTSAALRTILFFAIVMAISLIPSSVLSTQEAMPVSSSTGTTSTTYYLCNLCHSLKNDYPYPPPSSEQSVVRFADANEDEDNIEAFGMPWDRGITCIDVWNKVLDFQNPNIVDEFSCRSMAAVYAPQCCNDNDSDNDAVVVPVSVENETDNNTNENNKHKHNLRRAAS